MPGNIRGSSVLERTSRFVLEVLPYLLSALIAAVVVPGFLYSQVHGTKVTLVPTGLEMIQRDHDASAPAQLLSDRPTEPAEDKVAYR
jgi:hypothetical protein